MEIKKIVRYEIELPKLSLVYYQKEKTIHIQNRQTGEWAEFQIEELKEVIKIVEKIKTKNCV